MSLSSFAFFFQVLAKAITLPNWVFPININYGCGCIVDTTTPVTLDGAAVLSTNDEMFLSVAGDATVGNKFTISAWFRTEQKTCNEDALSALWREKLTKAGVDVKQAERSHFELFSQSKRDLS